MDRRTFMKLSALTGLGLCAPPVLRRAGAQAAGYEGPYFALVNASGGWDPRFMFDPIVAGEQNRLYTQVGSVGNIRFADFPVDAARLGIDPASTALPYLMSNQAFVQKYGARMTVLNGVDTATNNHDAGSRSMWSGRIPGQFPSFGALVAADRAPEQPMAFLSGGAYDVTDGLVPLARVENPDVMRKIALPNEISAGEPDTDHFHTPQTMERIVRAQQARLEALQKAQRLPAYQRAYAQLASARLGVADLARVQLPEVLVDIDDYSDLERLLRQAQFAVAAFKSGMAVTATLNLGGFDTHANHDTEQHRQVLKLLGGIDFLMSEAEREGLAGKLYVVVASDFARGPLYNSERDNAGKDHWPVTSMFVMGPGVPGDRVIGATDAEQQAVHVDAASLQPVSEGGVKLSPEIVHRALRRMAGVEAMDSKYPLPGDDLDLFG